MAYVTTSKFQELVERVAALEKRLASEEPYAEIEQPVYETVTTVQKTEKTEDEHYQEMVDLLGARYAALLKDAGFNTVAELKSSPAGDLTAVPGIGPGVVKKIKG